MNSTPYALRTYLQTFDNTVSKYVPLELFQDQVLLIEDYENFNENRVFLKFGANHCAIDSLFCWGFRIESDEMVHGYRHGALVCDGTVLDKQTLKK